MHANPALICFMFFVLWAINLALLLPSFFARRAHFFALLVLTALVTAFDGWMTWTFLPGALGPASPDKWFPVTVAVFFGLLFLLGCFGMVRVFRMAKCD